MADNPKAEKIAELQARVNKMAEELKKNPTEQLELRLTRETDLLRHLVNSLQGSPKSRAQETAEVAKIVALSRAIQPV